MNQGKKLSHVYNTTRLSKLDPSPQSERERESITAYNQLFRPTHHALLHRHLKDSLRSTCWYYHTPMPPFLPNILPLLVIPRRPLPCPVLPCPALSCLVLPYPTLPMYCAVSPSPPHRLTFTLHRLRQRPGYQLTGTALSTGPHVAPLEWTMRHLHLVKRNPGRLLHPMTFLFPDSP